MSSPNNTPAASEADLLHAGVVDKWFRRLQVAALVSTVATALLGAAAIAMLGGELDRYTDVFTAPILGAMVHSIICSISVATLHRKWAAGAISWKRTAERVLTWRQRALFIGAMAMVAGVVLLNTSPGDFSFGRLGSMALGVGVFAQGAYVQAKVAARLRHYLTVDTA